MEGSILHRAFTAAEEALLARTLVGRRLAREVRGADGIVQFASGAEIDRDLLDRARELELLDEVAAAAEPGTSDTELEDLFLWLAERRRARDAT
jgi:dsDNA-binding SOS-regulon protein